VGAFPRREPKIYSPKKWGPLKKGEWEERLKNFGVRNPGNWGEPGPLGGTHGGSPGAHGKEGKRELPEKLFWEFGEDQKPKGPQIKMGVF